MYPKTALYLLQTLARERMITVRHTTFVLPNYPQPVNLKDVRHAFESMREYLKFRPRDAIYTEGSGFEAWCSGPFFEKMFDMLFVKQMIWPKAPAESVHGGGPLPNIFVGTEKTQFRQIPLVSEKPWPFRFLLELGGMVVVQRPSDPRDVALELRQFLNNHPQFRVKVSAKEWPDGSIAIFTWWFEHVPKLQRRKNVNVPGQG